MDAKEYRSLATAALRAALSELERAVGELTDVCSQPVPADRAPRFELPGGFVWPCRDGGEVWWGHIGPAWSTFDSWYKLHDRYLPDRLFSACALEPELLVEALRTLEAAAAWCRDRLEYPGRVLAERPDLLEFIQARAVMGALEPRGEARWTT